MGRKTRDRQIILIQDLPSTFRQSDKVFPAYRINGEVIPVKHGFPLRVVAEGYYGYDWVKYVGCVTVDEVNEPVSEE